MSVPYVFTFRKHIRHVYQYQTSNDYMYMHVYMAISKQVYVQAPELYCRSTCKVHYTSTACTYTINLMYMYPVKSAKRQYFYLRVFLIAFFFLYPIFV